jgi:hypothetical protein
MVSGDPVGEAPVLAAALDAADVAEADTGAVARGVVLELELELHAVSAAPAARAAATRRTRNFIVPPEES